MSYSSMAGCQFLSVRVHLLACVLWGAWLNDNTTADQGDCRNNRFIKFVLPDIGHYLEGHVFLNLSIVEHSQCEEQCLLAKECVSINIGSPIDDIMACELSDSDHLQHPEDLKPRHGWTYRGTENLCATHPCLNNGKCLMGYTGKKYLCVCPAGFTGEHCERVPKSCSHLKMLNPTAESGNHVIDPDGEEGLAPFTVYCNMTDENGVGVTVISHASESPTLVNGYESPGSYSRDIHYTGASLSQLANLTGVSSHCEQFIKYECYYSRLLGRGTAWWVSRDSTKMTYWGGASSGSGKCACGMTNSCADSSYGCNCEKNDGVWREDSGLLTDKTKLPVKQLRFGDTEGSEQGYHTLGKLKCYGTA